MKNAWRVAGMAVLAASLCLAGCQLAALAGEGSEPAKYKFNKDQRVLVLVDVRDGVNVPPSFESALADKIGAHLYSFKAVDHLVSQEKLLQLREKDREGFKKMGLADIAVATDADVILYVDVVNLVTKVSDDNTVGVGGADTLVKVVDRKGDRLWPGDAAGTPVSASEGIKLLSDRDIPTTIQKMVDQLALLTGRMFHKYDLEDKELTQYDRVPPP